jgi:ABC-type polysaccharide/polyol phosphate transport system ATPase subunit
MLAGLMVPDRGRIRRHGSISNFELGIGFHPERNAQENIYLHGLLQGMSPKEIGRVMQRTLEFADIGKHAALPMKCLSTGMAMRLSFAAAAQVNADIYLFDEVLAVGDEQFVHRCFAYLQALRRSGKTAVIVSHDLNGLLKLCDRVVFFDQGRITGQQQSSMAEEERSKQTFARKGWASA